MKKPSRMPSISTQNLLLIKISGRAAPAPRLAPAEALKPAEALAPAEALKLADALALADAEAEAEALKLAEAEASKLAEPLADAEAEALKSPPAENDIPLISLHYRLECNLPIPTVLDRILDRAVKLVIDGTDLFNPAPPFRMFQK